jgi:hypothetical protein
MLRRPDDRRRRFGHRARTAADGERIHEAVAKAAAAGGGHIAEVEYEISADRFRPLGAPPEDQPAWLWCTYRPNGQEFLDGAVMGVVGSDVTWERLDDDGGRRRFLLRGNGVVATLFETEWTDPKGGWHYLFSLRPPP